MALSTLKYSDYFHHRLLALPLRFGQISAADSPRYIMRGHGLLFELSFAPPEHNSPQERSKDGASQFCLAGMKLPGMAAARAPPSEANRKRGQRCEASRLGPPSKVKERKKIGGKLRKLDRVNT